MLVGSDECELDVFFFFQAEDGIRDLTVTGVQTCALPIFKATLRGRRMWQFLERLIGVALPRIRDFRGVSPKGFDGRGNFSLGLREQIVFRSEERRVGKSVDLGGRRIIKKKK